MSVSSLSQQSQTPKKEKDIAKIQQKIAKLQKEIEANDLSYKQGIEKLEETRIKWEEEMTNCCALFEGLEINRISKMKDFFGEFNRVDEKVGRTCFLFFFFSFFSFFFLSLFNIRISSRLVVAAPLRYFEGHQRTQQGLCRVHQAGDRPRALHL